MAKKKKSFIDSILPHYYICGECAERIGGTWPEGHCATVHMGLCEYCNLDKKVLASITDYRWPFWDTNSVREF